MKQVVTIGSVTSPSIRTQQQRQTFSDAFFDTNIYYTGKGTFSRSAAPIAATVAAGVIPMMFAWSVMYSVVSKMEEGGDETAKDATGKGE